MVALLVHPCYRAPSCRGQSCHLVTFPPHVGASALQASACVAPGNCAIMSRTPGPPGAWPRSSREPRQVSETTPAILPPSSLDTADLAQRCGGTELVLSLATPDEYAEVEALQRGAHPADIFKPLTAGLLRWFIHDNPAGAGFLVLARPRPGGPVIGHFLFYATRLVHADGVAVRSLPAYLYVHLYVSPEHRRRGVFAGMFAFGLAVLSRMGVPFAYTVPNPRSSPGFVKFGVRLLGRLPVRMAPAWTAWNALVSLSAGRAVSLDVQRVDDFGHAMVRHAASAEAHHGRAAVWGARWREQLHWRYVQRPDAEYDILRVAGRAQDGYLVTRVLQIQKYRVLVVCDLALEPFDAATLHAALAAARAQRRDERVDLVMVQGGAGDARARQALWRAGLVRVPERLLPQPVAVFGGAPDDVGSTAGLPLLDRWLLTPCDWDVF